MTPTPRRLCAALPVAILGALLVPVTAEAAAAASTSTSTSASTAPASAPVRTIRLDGVAVKLRRGTKQVVTVNRTDGYRARVTYWKKEGKGDWDRRLQVTDGRIGYGGLVRGPDREQGTGTTPLGTYNLPWAFGQVTQKDKWELRYRRVKRGDYWVQDNASRFYNRYRNKSQGGFRWRLPASDPNSSERLKDYRTQYEWSIVTSFNRNQVRHRGSGIFLHVNGSGATAGCVSAPRAFIRALMFRLDPDDRPRIAIGR